MSLDILQILQEVEDPRSYHGREYRLHHILLFTILSILNNGKKYVDIHRFIEAHFEKLKEIFKLKWRQVPDVSAIRKIIVAVDPEELENALRKHSSELIEESAGNNNGEKKHICFDGKALNGSFSKCKDQRATRVFSAFSSIGEIVLAHIDMEDVKDHEIPAFQEFIMSLNLKDVVITADAMHCQKKLLSAQRK
jgi:hypothetical protein